MFSGLGRRSQKDPTSPSSPSSNSSLAISSPTNPTRGNNPLHSATSPTNTMSSTRSYQQQQQPMLPEELTARERLRERERERQREREREKYEVEMRQRDLSAGQRSNSVRSGSSSTAQSQSDKEPSRYSSNHMESSVTRLLVATKMLLESLTKWSMGQRDESEVSDIYVRLGNDFNTARAAFGSYGIDMSDLISIPDDLRVCLERCLSEEASPSVLEVHLPRIREIIVNLLQGLKLKQAQYKQYLLQQRAQQRNSLVSTGGGGGLNRAGSISQSQRESTAGSSGSRSSTRAEGQGYQRSSRNLRQGISENANAGSRFLESNTEALEPSVNARPESLHRGTSSGVLPTSISSATVRPTSTSTAISSGSNSRRPVAPPRLDEETNPVSQRGSSSGSIGRSSGAGIVRPPSRTKSGSSSHDRSSQIQNESRNEELPTGRGGEIKRGGGSGRSLNSDSQDVQGSMTSKGASELNSEDEVERSARGREDSADTATEERNQETPQMNSTNRVPDDVVRHSLIDEPTPKFPVPSFEVQGSSPDVVQSDGTIGKKSNPSSSSPSPMTSRNSGSKPPSASVKARKTAAAIAASAQESSIPASTSISSSSSSNSLALPRDSNGGSNNLAVDSDPSLRALKSRDALERRASKRFSAYTFNKMGIGAGYAQMGMSSLTGTNSTNGTPTHGNTSQFIAGGSPNADGGKKSLNGSPVDIRHSFKKGRASNTSLVGDTSMVDYSSPARSAAFRRGFETIEGGLGSLDESPNLGALDSPNESRSSSRRSSHKSPKIGVGSINNTFDSLAAPRLDRQGSTASSDHSANFVDATDGGEKRGSMDEKVTSPVEEIETLEKEGSVPPVPPLPTLEERERLDAIQNSRLQGQSSGDDENENGLGLGLSPNRRDLSSSNISVHLTPNSQRVSSSSSNTNTYTNKNNKKNLNVNVNGSSFSNDPDSLTVFLQLGRQNRKAVLDLKGTPLSIVRLRMLFMDRFSYSPGMDDFPTICIKHVESGVAYELEDLEDVIDGTVLTLNIEPLDQVKQHLDLTLGVITRELRDLKATVNERRSSRNFSAEGLNAAAAASIQAQVQAQVQSQIQALGLATGNVSSPPGPSPAKISDSQFAAAGQRVAQLKRVNTTKSPVGNEEEPIGIHSPALSSASMTSSTGGTAAAGAKVASELKSQYDELQSLRREFAILKQIQDDFGSDISGILKGVRDQSARVRAIAASEVPAERNFIIAGKSRLDSGSQEVLTLVEDLQDTVDDLKLDVIQRGVKPKLTLMKTISSDIEKATKGLEELENYVRTVKPSWKKTWENELQNIVDEQGFLNHQEGLLADLRDDNTALQEVFENIQQVVKLRGPVSRSNLAANGTTQNGNPLAGITLQRYVPPPPEDGHAGLDTVMMEVRTQSVDHERRLRALQAAERTRAKELASKSDEFQDELKGFVDTKALRKTGGHLEAERIRQRRDKATINAMFGGGGIGGGVPSPTSNTVKGEPPKKFILGKDKSAKTEESRDGEKDKEEVQLDSDDVDQP